MNTQKADFIKVRFDGCVVKQETAADYLLFAPEKRLVIIELKGKNVAHAIEQVFSTLSYLRKKKIEYAAIAAIIVCKENPCETTTTQRAKDRFQRESGGFLHVIAGNYEYAVENVMSFRPLSDKKGKCERPNKAAPSQKKPAARSRRR